MSEPFDFPSHDLAIVETSESVELVDKALGTWIVRFEAMTFTTEGPQAESAVGAAIIRSLSGFVPQISAALPRAGDGIRVAFSPEVQRALANGTYRLMNSASRQLPVAVDSAGKIVKIARVMPSAATTAGGGVALGAAAAAAWPIVLVAGVAMAASWAEQRWLEKTFSELRNSLQRIEARLRDDDFGILEAADSLVDLIRQDALEGNIPEFQCWQLAAAQQNVEGIYLSRRRFVERFKKSLEERQTRHEEKTGESQAWVSGVTDDLGDAGKGIRDELTVFLTAMITRARVSAASAAILASNGDALSALRLVRNLEESLRNDYHDLYRRLVALSKYEPDTPRWKRMMPMDRDEPVRAHEFVVHISSEMKTAIGDSLPSSNEPLILETKFEDLNSA